MLNLTIEPANFCNARCRYCVLNTRQLSHGSKKTLLSLKTHNQIFADLDSFMSDDTCAPYADKNVYVRYAGVGEPLLNPDFIEMIKVSLSHPLVKQLAILSNGSYWAPEFVDSFLKIAEKEPYKPLELIFSLDTVDPRIQYAIKGLNNIKTINKQLIYLLDEKARLNLKDVHPVFQAIVTDENAKSLQDFLEFWAYVFKQKGFSWKIVSSPDYPVYFADTDCFLWLKTRGSDGQEQLKYDALQRGVFKQATAGFSACPDNFEKIPEAGSQKKGPINPFAHVCSMLWYGINISASADVSPCCIDIDYSLKVGNLSGQNISDAYRSDKMQDMRLAQINKKLKDYPLCMNCSLPYKGLEAGAEEVSSYIRTVSSWPGINTGVYSANLPSLRKFSVCILSREYPPDTAWGGIGTYSYNLARGLAAAGQNVHVICQSLDVDREYTEGGVFVHRVAHKTFFPFKGRFREFLLRWEYSQSIYNKLKEVVGEYNIDIVEAPNLSGEGFVYSLHKRTPLVTRLHTHFSELIGFLGWKRDIDRRLSCWIENAVIMRSDKVLCSTNAHADLVSRETGLAKDRIAIVPLGIDLPDLSSQENQPHPKTVLFVGRLEKRKGPHILMKAVPRVLKKIPDARFIVIGRDSFTDEKCVNFSGEKKHSFKEQLVAMLPEPCRKNVEFLGYVPAEELGRYYKDCDVFAGPSLYESFGFIYIEAMSYAKPAIGCGVGGVPEVIEDGITGLLVPPEDDEKLASAIVYLLENSEKAKEIGRSARRHVEKEFTIGKMTENTLAVYSECLKSKKYR